MNYGRGCFASRAHNFAQQHWRPPFSLCVLLRVVRESAKTRTWRAKLSRTQTRGAPNAICCSRTQTHAHQCSQSAHKCCVCVLAANPIAAQDLCSIQGYFAIARTHIQTWRDACAQSTTCLWHAALSAFPLCKSSHSVWNGMRTTRVSKNVPKAGSGNFVIRDCLFTIDNQNDRSRRFVTIIK